MHLPLKAYLSGNPVLRSYSDYKQVGRLHPLSSNEHCQIHHQALWWNPQEPQRPGMDL